MSTGNPEEASRECSASDSRSNFKSFARSEFDKHLSIGKKDFNAIEYLLRKGTRQLEMYSSPGIRNIR
ncbi:hypothetical protein BJX61DRAFT_541864 [Aspergillus egyptiacus]|nr:hypothetical protein BJX61DRAFT_541864 [Aspergillus egyptiacus]